MHFATHGILDPANPGSSHLVLSNGERLNVFDIQGRRLKNTDLAVPIPLLPGTTYTFGFFLTLQSGNGAQGNTQVPAFRQYLDFTVVGF